MYTPEKVYAYGDIEKLGSILSRALSTWFDLGERLAVSTYDRHALTVLKDRAAIIKQGLEEKSLMKVAEVLGQEGLFFEDLREVDHKLLTRSLSRELCARKVDILFTFLSEKLNRPKSLTQNATKEEINDMVLYISKTASESEIKQIYGRELAYISRLASNLKLDDEVFSVSIKNAISLCISRV
jgi:hypothetical protein